MNSKMLAAVFFAAAMTVTIGMQSVYAQTNATGTAVIEEATCGLAFNGTSTRDYGTLKNGDEQFQIDPLYLINTGNSDAVLTVIGYDWKEVGNSTNTVMYANQTHWEYAGNTVNNLTEYGFGFPFDGTEQLVDNIIPENPPLDIDLGLLVDLIDPVFTGDITQTMTFQATC